MSQAYNSSYSYTPKSPYPAADHFPTPAIELDIDLLLRICDVQSYSGYEGAMQAEITDICAEMGLERILDQKGNMYFTKGEIAEGEYVPCMVAHMDTVHNFVEDYQVFQDGDVLFAFNRNLGRMTGIGGDDKSGIAIALNLLKLLPKMKVAFFVEEETGCHGSREANMAFFNNVSMVLQCDRKGHDDFVQTVAGTQVSSDAFITAIKPLLDTHGYKTIQSGGITDVGQLKSRGLDVCAANMSCGYFSPHSKEETIHLPTTANTLSLCYQIFQLLGTEKQPHVKPVYVAKENKAYVSTGKAWGPYTDPTWESVRTREPGKSYDTYNWIKTVNGEVVAGPCDYNATFTLEAEYRKRTEKPTAVAVVVNPDKDSRLKKQKRLLRLWIEKDGTWSFSKLDKVWEKVVDNYVVAYAERITQIPSLDAEYHKKIDDGWKPSWISHQLHSSMDADEPGTSVEVVDGMDDEERMAYGKSVPLSSEEEAHSHYHAYQCHYCKTETEGYQNPNSENFWCDGCNVFVPKDRGTAMLTDATHGHDHDLGYSVI